MSDAGSHEESSLSSLQAGRPSDGGPAPRRAPLRRRWQAWAAGPGPFLAAGVVLLVLGTALVATPLSIARGSEGAAQQAPPPPPPLQAGVDAEGVPLDALPSTAAEGHDELSDCRVQLPDRAGYTAAAAAAEARLLGGAAADLNRTQLERAVGGLPPLLFGTVFWVLASEGHPWTPEFEPAAAAQVQVLNAAFAGLNMRFRLDGVVHTPVGPANLTSSSARPLGSEVEDDAGSSSGGGSSSSAGDAMVQQCSRRWAQLAAQLLPAGASSGGASSSSEADPPAIHVIVCEPAGANGAASVLGGGQWSAEELEEGEDEEDEGWFSRGGRPGTHGTLLLRRGALWQSRTSVVHQLGHFLGLAHPFPDRKETCKLDGDGVADTPRQYAPNRGCSEGEEAEGDMHVCPSADDGPVAASQLPVPVVNYMDLTSDACRRHFTLGQAARMQAMLRAHRPRLFAAAAAAPQPQAALVVQAAWQSALPPAAVRQAQREGAMHQVLLALNSSTAGIAASSSSVGAAVQAAADVAGLYADSLRQAALAADGQLSTALHECACLGVDSRGRALWMGQLNASYPVAAVRLLLPAQLWVEAAPEAAEESDASEEEEDDSSDAEEPEGSSGSSGSAAPAPLPAPEAAAGAAAASAALAAAAAAIGLDVRVGDSLDPEQNQPCAPAASNRLQLLDTRRPLQEVRCEVPISGRYVSVALTVRALPQQLCLCEVQPLSAAVPALPRARAASSGGDGGGTRLPAVPLNLTGAVAFQSSSKSVSLASSAAAALAAWPQEPSRQQCSCTRSEAAPWWVLDTGLDGAWVRGVRLTTPLICQASPRSAAAAPECQPPPPGRLSVYVGDVPPQQLPPGGDRSSTLCAGGVEAPGGQPLDVDCGRFMHGRYVTVVAAGQGRNSSLSLCGVQLLGADELLLSQRMQQPAAAGEPSVALQVHPPALQAQAATPIDGNAASCLEAPAGAAASSSWQLRLDGSFPVQAVRLVATPALAQAAKQGGGAAGGGNLTVALLDAAGLEVAAWQVPARQAARAARAAGGSAGGGTTLELPVAVYAAAVRVGGFASLCELQLLASASLPPATHRLGPLPALASSGRPAGTWQVVDGASGQPDAAASLALLDGNPTTCATFRPGPAQQNAALELQLDRPVQLAAVQLLAGGLRGLNVSIAAAPWSPGAGAPAGFAAAWAGAAACQPRLGLQPWAPANAPCKFAQPPPPGHQRPALLTDRLLVQLVAPVANASAAAPAELTLCELALYGLPAAPAA